MSQEQLSRREEEEMPIKYGDVFKVSGELASKAVAPQDAALMQSAETRVYGRTQKGGPAAAMQQAASLNERAGVVGHQDVTEAAGDEGVTVTETDVPGARIFTESVAGQVVSQHVEVTPVLQGGQEIKTAGQDRQVRNITIGEALEATAKTAGDKPVEQCDAAAIQAAEVRATGRNVTVPGGVAAAAQSAASFNAQLTGEDDSNKIKLVHVLENATARMPADKPATRDDAEGVVSAELRNNPNLATHPAGVAAAVTAAARLNELNQPTGGSSAQH